MEYKLYREKRRTISLRVLQNGEVVVKAPMKAPKTIIENFIIAKRTWIEKQLARLSNVLAFKENFDFKNKLYILGKGYDFAQFDIALLGAEEQEIWKYYHKFALSELQKMVKSLSISTGLKYKDLKLSSSRRNWGSFDRNGNMKLNYKLIILPEELIKYVILHELCHGVELNHSKAFWSKVGEFCPNYKLLKKELEKYSFLLTI